MYNVDFAFEISRSRRNAGYILKRAKFEREKRKIDRKERYIERKRRRLTSITMGKRYVHSWFFSIHLMG